MKNQIQLKERGQALVIIALAAVVLFGFAALSIDGSRVFSDRRHAQNAADTSVLDAVAFTHIIRVCANRAIGENDLYCGRSEGAELNW